ncbi:MAG TPA: hypothetical protein VE650_09785 [Acetobacteraceae bacterium]|jgi:fatty acid desaturase|nr:hypothetical protein [Acetobacteraceae bacterium]
MKRLARPWGVMLGLVLLELVLMLLHLGPATPFVALAMMGIVVMGPMELGRAPTLARIFALAGAFWVVFVLFGLGMLDPLTRHDLPTFFHSEP